MGRPRKFDIDKAIDDAMRLFWQRGYTETGLSDLCDAMGIVRGSFYKAFASKHALFLLVLRRYRRDFVETAISNLKVGERSGEDRIAGVFKSIQRAARDGDKRGCLLCNTAAGPAMEDDEIQSLVSEQIEALTQAFSIALKATEKYATARHELRLAQARLLTLNYVGVRVLSRGAFEVSTLDDAVNRILAD